MSMQKYVCALTVLLVVTGGFAAGVLDEARLRVLVVYIKDPTYHLETMDDLKSAINKAHNLDNPNQPYGQYDDCWRVISDEEVKKNLDATFIDFDGRTTTCIQVIMHSDRHALLWQLVNRFKNDSLYAAKKILMEISFTK